MRRAVAWVALICIAGQQAEGATASHCDPNLPVRSEPDGYHERGDRCEGIFFLRTASDSQTINIVSLTWEPLAGIDVRKPQQLSAPSMSRSDVNIRAETVPESGRFFRMDTRVSKGGGSFLWTTPLLSSLAILPAQLGILGWAEPSGAGGSRILVPLHVTEKGVSATPPKTLIIRVKPTQRLSSLSLQINDALGQEQFGPVRAKVSQSIAQDSYLDSNVTASFEVAPLPQTPKGFIVISAHLADDPSARGARTASYLFTNE